MCSVLFREVVAALIRFLEGAFYLLPTFWLLQNASYACSHTRLPARLRFTVRHSCLLRVDAKDIQRLLRKEVSKHKRAITPSNLQHAPRQDSQTPDARCFSFRTLTAWSNADNGEHVSHTLLTVPPPYSLPYPAVPMTHGPREGSHCAEHCELVRAKRWP